MNTPRAILFDLDGTLLDSAPHFTRILNVLLAQALLPLISIDQVRGSISGGVKAMIYGAFGASIDEATLKQLSQAFLVAYEQLIEAEMPLTFAGLLDVVQTLTRLNIPFGIVTNKHQRFAEKILAKTFFNKSLACVIYGDTLPTPKPSPQPLYLACQRLAVPPTETWFVGDARVDMEAAAAAGCIPILAHYGYVESDWRTWPATHQIQQLSDLLVWL